MGKDPEAVAGKCSRCGETDEAKFTPRNFAKIGGWCRACHLAYNREYRERQTGKPVRPRVAGTAGVCSNCGETDKTQFTPSALKRPGQWCKPCMATYRRQRDEHGVKRADRYRGTERARRIAWLRDVKKSGCVKCGENDPACLDLHHPDEGSKRFSVGHKLHSLARAELEAEVAKTIVLCSNCHRKMHYYSATGPYGTKKEGRGYRRFPERLKDLVEL